MTKLLNIENNNNNNNNNNSNNNSSNNNNNNNNNNNKLYAQAYHSGEYYVLCYGSHQASAVFNSEVKLIVFFVCSLL